MSPTAEVISQTDVHAHADVILSSTLTGLLMRFRHVSGRKLPLAAGNTPISCSSGLNCTDSQIRPKIESRQHPDGLLLRAADWWCLGLTAHGQAALKAAPQSWGQPHLQAGTFKAAELWWNDGVQYVVCHVLLKLIFKTHMPNQQRGHVFPLDFEGHKDRRGFHLTGLVPFSKSVNIPLMSLKSEANGA